VASFGEAIAEKRKELGYSQRELAAMIIKEDGSAISGQYLNDLEKNRRNPPTDYLMAEFAKALKLPLEYLFLCAGTMPPDVRSVDMDPEEAVELFKAFRRGNPKG